MRSDSPHDLAVQILGSDNGVEVDRHRKLVGVVLDALPARWQPIDHEAGHTVPNERGPGPNANRGATCQLNLLQRQRAVVIVRQIGTRAGATSRLEKFLASVATVVDLNVSREEFGGDLARAIVSEISMTFGFRPAC